MFSWSNENITKLESSSKVALWLERIVLDEAWRISNFSGESWRSEPLKTQSSVVHSWIQLKTWILKGIMQNVCLRVIPIHVDRILSSAFIHRPEYIPYKFDMPEKLSVALALLSYLHRSLKIEMDTFYMYKLSFSNLSGLDRQQNQRGPFKFSVKTRSVAAWTRVSKPILYILHNP